MGIALCSNLSVTGRLCLLVTIIFYLVEVRRPQWPCVSREWHPPQLTQLSLDENLLPLHYHHPERQRRCGLFFVPHRRARTCTPPLFVFLGDLLGV